MDDRELVLLSSILEDSTVPVEKVLEKLMQTITMESKPGSPHTASVDRLLAIRSTFLALAADNRALYGNSIAETICFPILRGQQSRVQEKEEADEETASTAVVLARLFCSVAEYCSDALLSSLFASLLESSCWADHHGASIVGFLHHSLTHRPTMMRLERIEQLPDQLFTYLLSVLRSAERTLCYHVSSLVLPALLDSSRIGRLWEFVCCVWNNQIVVEMENRDLVLTLLCCLNHVFIPTGNMAVPATSNLTVASTTSALSSDCFDIREEKLFWDVVQTGLSSSDDPLARKRCLFLLDRVLRSFSGGDKSVAFPGGVFWWSKEEERELTVVWQDVRLLLETLEEKQVRHTHSSLLSPLQLHRCILSSQYYNTISSRL